eukprot:scaffold152477_cov17-Tisochrysis_lutea.AAC.1
MLACHCANGFVKFQLRQEAPACAASWCCRCSGRPCGPVRKSCGCQPTSATATPAWPPTSTPPTLTYPLQAAPTAQDEGAATTAA